MNKIRSAYLFRRITEAQAKTDLLSLGASSAAVAQYITAWDIEKATEVKELTYAQVGAAVKNGFMTDTDALARWTAMGYSDGDAAIMLAIYGGPPPVGSPAAAAEKKVVPVA